MELSRTATAVHAAVARWRRFTSQNRPRDADRVAEQIVAAHLPMLTSLAAKLSTTEISREDLIQAGRVALLGALERFNPDNGASFLTFATGSVEGTLLRYLRDNTSGAIHQPHHIRELRSKIERATAVIAARGAKANADNLAQELGCPVIEIKKLLAIDAWAAHCPARFGDDACCGDDDSGGCGRCAIDAISAADTQIVLDQALSRCLSEQEQEIIHLRFREQQTLREIGERLGVSGMTVSRIEERALAKLRAVLTEDSL